jgi:hypothetical protein
MSIEEKIKFQLGDLMMACTALKEQLDEANAEIKRLRDKYELPEGINKSNGHDSEATDLRR